MTNQDNNNNNDQEEKIDYDAVQTEILLLIKERLPHAQPEHILSLMGALTTSIILGTADMVKDLNNKFLNKQDFSLTLLDLITRSVKESIKSNYEMEKLV